MLSKLRARNVWEEIVFPVVVVNVKNKKILFRHVFVLHLALFKQTALYMFFGCACWIDSISGISIHQWPLLHFSDAVNVIMPVRFLKAF